MMNMKINQFSFTYYLQFDHKKACLKLFISVSYRIKINETGRDLNFVPSISEFHTYFKINKVSSVVHCASGLYLNGE